MAPTPCTLTTCTASFIGGRVGRKFAVEEIKVVLGDMIHVLAATGHDNEVVMDPYAHPLHMKVVKHLVYV